MKQTVSIFAPDINVASKSSAIQLWLNRKNQFFSSVLEEGVSNRQVLLLGHASFVFSALICASFVSQVPALICLPLKKEMKVPSLWEIMVSKYFSVKIYKY